MSPLWAQIRCVTIAIAILLYLTVQPAIATNDEHLYNRIAGTLIGEGGIIGDDYEIMACAVRNRLERGWTLDTVLRQYNARYVTPTQTHIDILRAVIAESSDKLSPECNQVYFAYATWYANLWINPNVKPVIVVGRHNYYRYEDYRNLWH